MSVIVNVRVTLDVLDGRGNLDVSDVATALDDAIEGLTIEVETDDGEDVVTLEVTDAIVTPR